MVERAAMVDTKEMDEQLTNLRVQMATPPCDQPGTVGLVYSPKFEGEIQAVTLSFPISFFPASEVKADSAISDLLASISSHSLLSGVVVGSACGTQNAIVQSAFRCGSTRVLCIHLGAVESTRVKFDEDSSRSLVQFEISPSQDGLAESVESSENCTRVCLPLTQTASKADFLAVILRLILPVVFEAESDMTILSLDASSFEVLADAHFAAFLVHLLHSFAQQRFIVRIEPNSSQEVGIYLREILSILSAGSAPKSQASVKAASISTISAILTCIARLQSRWKCFEFYPVANSAAARKFADWPEYPSSSADSAEVHTDNDTPSTAPPQTSVETQTGRVVVGYDSLMERHQSQTGWHPECPERLSAIVSHLQKEGLWEQCDRVAARRASVEELQLAHSAAYVQRMAATERMSGKQLRRVEARFNSVFLCPDSYDCARLAVGTLLEVVEAVVSDGEAAGSAGAALVRPPGHHAETDAACGFCLFDNVAVAARRALQLGVRRVLLLDWDVHHGNGLQHAFYHEANVLYISLHRFDLGYFFPCSQDANHLHAGGGDGLGFNVNVPWNADPSGDAEYVTAFLQVVLPVALEFAPELVLVSAGLDAARGDPLGGYDVTAGCFGLLTRLLRSLAGGRVVLALEGGYHLDAIARSTADCLRALLRCRSPHPQPAPSFGGGLDELSWDTLRQVAAEHERYWTCLRGYQRILAEPVVPLLSDDMDISAGMSHLHLDLDHSGGAVGCSSSSADGGVDSGLLVSRSFLGLSAAADDQLTLHAVQPLSWCPHLEAGVTPLLDRALDHQSPCADCRLAGESWICLQCFRVGCSRYQEMHACVHTMDSGHPLALSCADLSVWCYPCDAYVHHPSLSHAKRSLHLNKFAVPPP